MNDTQKFQKLDDVSNYSMVTGINFILLKEQFKVLSKYYHGKTCLELGPADGGATGFLVNHFDRVVAVDGSPDMIRRLKENIKSEKLETICAYFEDLNFTEKFDTVVMSHVLEHVDDPIHVLKLVQKFMHKNSVLIADVPNALSVHKDIGVIMGIIPDNYALSPVDISVGHQRFYDLKTLVADVEKSGLAISDKGGVFLKPLSNAQMEKLFNENEKLIDAFAQWGQKHPEMSAEIYVVAKLKQN